MGRILDACCGGRMFWFDKQNDHTTYMDNRELDEILCDGRRFTVKPDVVADFRDIPFGDQSFDLVVFDPPHLIKLGNRSYMNIKYSKLEKDTWQDDLKKALMSAGVCSRITAPWFSNGMRIRYGFLMC